MIVLQGLSESPDLEFEYADTDKWAAELSGVFFDRTHSHLRVYRALSLSLLLFQHLSELYSYTEGPEFALNRKCFEVEFREHGIDSVFEIKERYH